MEDIRKTTEMQKQINGKTYDVEVEVIRRKHLTGGTEFRINVTIKLDGHEVHDTMVELAVFKDIAEMFSPDKLAEEENVMIMSFIFELKSEIVAIFFRSILS